MEMKIFVQRTLHIFGSFLGIAGVIFVIFKLNIYADQLLDFSRFDATDLILIVISAVIYGAANILLSLAWFDLLVYLGVGSVARPWAMKVYGLSQLAKYVPGNIFHLAGRQVYGMAAGISVLPLAKSSALELGMIATVGGLFSILLVPFVWPGLPSFVAVGLFVATVFILFICAHKFVSDRLAWALLWQAVFHIVSGSVFILILAVVVLDNLEVLPVSLLCGSYVIAWLAGLLTPGSPAGIGIREAVLLFLLGNALPQADLLLSVLLGRVVTVLGDLIYFAISSFMKVDHFNKS
jgi:glycosyltransferase 2 family protein